MSLLKFHRIPYFSVLRLIKPFVRRYNDISFEDIPEVSPAIIKRTLKAHNVTFDDGFTCFIITCPICQKTTKANLKNVYINKTTGMFVCTTCKHTGQWDSLEKRFTTKKKRGKSQEDQQETGTNEVEKLNKFINDLRDVTDQVGLFDQKKFCDILKKFQLPQVSKTSIENLDIRIDKSEEHLYFPLENNNLEIVGYRKFNILNRSDIAEPNVIYGGLLIGKTIRNKETAILVPNIEDFLVLLDSKLTGSIVCLPNGVNNLSQYVLPTLERFKKLILWFGNDLKSWESAKHFAKKLGEKRCLFIRPSEKHLLPHLIDKSQFKAIISTAQPIWHKSITTFSSLRQDVLLDLQNIEKVQGIKWKRYPQLNKILKGHRRGELTVFTGPTGSGKTTFISEYSLDLATQGVNTLWGSFEIRNVRLAKTMLQQLAGLPLDEHLDLFDNWADKFEQLPIYFMTFHGQQSLKIVMEAVEHATYVHDIAHVIIDNLQFMMGTTDDYRYMDRFWKQDTIIAAFRTFATRKNCHVTLVIHPRKERDDEDLTTSSIFGGAKATQEADNVLIIQDKRLAAVGGKKYLQIAKNRYSGDLGIMTLDFDKQSLSFVTKKKKTQQKETIEKAS